MPTIKSEYLYPKRSITPKINTNGFRGLKPPSSTMVRGQISLISNTKRQPYFFFKISPLRIDNNDRLETIMTSGLVNNPLFNQNKFHSKCTQLNILRADLATLYFIVLSHIKVTPWFSSKVTEAFNFGKLTKLLESEVMTTGLYPCLTNSFISNHPLLPGESSVSGAKYFDIYQIVLDIIILSYR